MTKLEVLFSPAEFETLTRRDLSGTTCVVFDVLRATSSIVTALAHGASAILPVVSIHDALAAKNRDASILLAGERDGFRITAELTGGVDFNFGNSPREFLDDAIRGKRIAMTTTNGTRALQSCKGARDVFVASFLNLAAVADRLREAHTTDLLLVCSGTYEEASFEDLLGAGALANEVWEQFAAGHVADSAQVARNIYLAAAGNLLGAMQFARNGRRLLAIPELKDDVAFCLQRNIFPVVPSLDSDGEVRCA